MSFLKIWCWEKIERDWCKCVTCNILLHDTCEERYRGEKKYCEILDTKIQYENDFNDLNVFQNCELDKI